MIEVQRQEFRDQELTKNLVRISDLGVKTPLGTVIVFLLMWKLPADFDSLVKDANTASGGAPASGVEEEKWLVSLRDVECKKIPADKISDSYALYNYTCNDLNKLISTKDWQLERFSKSLKDLE